MARLEKTRQAFAACQGTFPYNEFKRLIKGLGYEEPPKGKTGGSRRKFFNKDLDDMIFLDEPHDGEMKSGMVRRLRKHLNDKGLL